MESLYQVVDIRVSLSGSGHRCLYIRFSIKEFLYQVVDIRVYISDS